MSNRKDIPEDVPDEVKLVLAHLRPEPEVLAEDREKLLAELDMLMASAPGPVHSLLDRMRTVLLSTRTEAPFEPRIAREFTEALENYRKDPAAPKPPPELLLDCLLFLRELVRARGLGPLLQAVDEVSPAPSDAEAKARQQLELQTRIRLSNTRG
jgi:hypothetical protein